MSKTPCLGLSCYAAGPSGLDIIVMNSSFKWWLHAIGAGLGLAGVFFVTLRLYSYADQVDFFQFNLISWSVIAILSITYGISNLLLANAWCLLLDFFKIQVGRKWAIKVYGQSQLARYVPGNIFQIAGRQALGMAAGIPAKPLAKSAVWELGIIAVAGSVFSLLIIPLVWPEFLSLISSILFLVISVLIFTALYIIFFPSVAVTFFIHLIFLAVSGLIFIGTLSIVVTPLVPLSVLPSLCGAYVVAWLAGFVTPGAPAGVGVREMVLLFLLGGQIGQSDLLMAVVLGRIVTVTGDLIYFLVASFLKQDRFIHEK